ncbi:MAG TPA: hypothetical protein VII66_06990 [Gemmatimonadaceae bacterium]
MTSGIMVAIAVAARSLRWRSLDMMRIVTHLPHGSVVSTSARVNP